MHDQLIGRGLRALRHRRGLRQSDLARAAGVARSLITDFEAGRLDEHSVGALRRAADAAGGWIRIDLIVAGEGVRRLLDADHAQLQAHWKGWLERHAWVVVPELTFNHFGERGSIDLFAWHPASATLLVIEIKTAIVDMQELLSGIDRKVRIGARLSRERGWTASAVVPVLLVAEGSTARRRIVEHGALVTQFALRGRRAMRWMSDPSNSARPRAFCASRRCHQPVVATVDELDAAGSVAPGPIRHD